MWLVLLLLAAVLAGGVVWAVTTAVGPGDPRLITVREGQSVWEVAAMLEAAGLVRSAHALTAAAYATGKWRQIQAGRHEVDPGMTGLEILDALARGSRRAWRWLTIPEGLTLRQVAEKVEEEGLGLAAEFLNAGSRPETFEAGFSLPEDSLEGYLFPDTYRIEQDQGARGTIAQMLRRFDQVVWQELFGGEAEYGGRSLREVIVLASLVEAEAKRDEERAIIAGVLVNRLERGQRLECDATVQYALGKDRKSRLVYKDLEVESDYNTYLHHGLPPGPICNPGEASIRAAMEPADVPYLYYVARADGSHVFSRTFAEHGAAAARIRRAEK
jgi:UPF0755 protein